MVALAIVGLALSALLFQVMGNVDHQAYLRDKTLAMWVAENQLAESLLQRSIGQRVLTGSTSGIDKMAGVDWHWQIDSTPTSVNGMRRLEIVVGLHERETLVGLVGFVHE
jgi:general secretion pathway protein I